jgi:hypothetical protein
MLGKEQMASWHVFRGRDARVVVYDLGGVRLVEASGEMRLSSSDTNCVGNSLTEWACIRHCWSFDIASTHYTMPPLLRRTARICYAQTAREAIAPSPQCFSYSGSNCAQQRYSIVVELTSLKACTSPRMHTSGSSCGRTCSDLHARCNEVLRVSRSFGMQLAEILDVIHLKTHHRTPQVH